MMTTMSCDESAAEALMLSVLSQAKSLGMDQAEVALQTGHGEDLSIRESAVESVEGQHDQHIALTVYQNQRQASVSLSSLDASDVAAALKSACEAVPLMEPDPYAGLADSDRMVRVWPDLDLWHPWGVSQAHLIDLGSGMEADALAQSQQLSHCEGVSINRYASVYAYANSHGCFARQSGTRHGISLALVAKAGDALQRDSDFTVARCADDLTQAAELVASCVERTLSRLGAKPIPTGHYPVLLDPMIAGRMWGCLLAGISGGNLYRHQSFLCDALGKRVLPDWLTLREEPWLPRALGSAGFDSDGVATLAKDFVKDGVLRQYILGAYAARRLGLPNTGNADGVHNLMVLSQDPISRQALFEKMGSGLYVTEMMGSGVDITTGRMSQGVFGYWVDQGKLQYPVEGVTIAGDLRELFQSIQAVGTDLDHRGNIVTGSVLLSPLMVAGA